MFIAKNRWKLPLKIFARKNGPGSLVNQGLQRAGFYEVPYLEGIDTKMCDFCGSFHTCFMKYHT